MFGFIYSNDDVCSNLTISNNKLKVMMACINRDLPPVTVPLIVREFKHLSLAKNFTFWGSLIARYLVYSVFLDITLDILKKYA